MGASGQPLELGIAPIDISTRTHAARLTGERELFPPAPLAPWLPNWPPAMLTALVLLLISAPAAAQARQGPAAAASAAARVAPTPAAAAAQLCRTSEHGAQPSEEQPATAALQAAIDACTSRQAGQACGRVVVDTPGTYLCGALLAADGCVHVELPAGTRLLASNKVRGVCRSVCMHLMGLQEWVAILPVLAAHTVCVPPSAVRPRSARTTQEASRAGTCCSSATAAVAA